MKSRFKFRVWDKILNKYISWSPFISFDDDNYIIEQWTGLFDKNGKEIYEGDLVENPNVDMYIYGQGKRSPVTYFDGAFHLTCFYDFLPRSFHEIRDRLYNYDLHFPDKTYLYNYLKNYEVVGNINENPELSK